MGSNVEGNGKMEYEGAETCFDLSLHFWDGGIYVYEGVPRKCCFFNAKCSNLKKCQ
jgi:hypothetical protein